MHPIHNPKQQAREEIERLMREFKGEIQVIPGMQSKFTKVETMRAGEVELIGFDVLACRWKVSRSSLNGILVKWPTLVWVTIGGMRHFALSDVEELEKQPGFRLKRPEMVDKVKHKV